MTARVGDWGVFKAGRLIAAYPDQSSALYERRDCAEANDVALHHYTVRPVTRADLLSLVDGTAVAA